MSTYIRFLEILSQAPNTEDTFKRMLKGKNLKKAGEQVKQYIEKYGRLCRNPIYENSIYYDKNGPRVQFLTYYVFPFVTAGPLKNIHGLIKIYKFFFEPVKVVVQTQYAYE